MKSNACFPNREGYLILILAQSSPRVYLFYQVIVKNIMKGQDDRKLKKHIHDQRMLITFRLNVEVLMSESY